MAPEQEAHQVPHRCKMGRPKQVPQPESDSLLLREVPIWEQSRGNSASLPPVTRNTAWPLLVKTLHIELEGLNRPNDLSQAMLI